MSEEKDPWASLADALGAAPSGESSPQPPRRPVEKPRSAPPRAATPPASQGWDGLDSTLGLPPTRESSRPPERRSAEPRPAAEAPPTREPRGVDRPASPPRREMAFDEEPRRFERSDRSERTARAEGGDRGDAPEPDNRREGGEPRGDGTEPDGEGRPRRRRGRRGGRGRGRGRREREGTTAPSRLDDERAPRDADINSEPLDDLVDERPTAAGEPAERPLDEDGRPRRRRRRRGRRGGRRGAATGERSVEPGGDTAARSEPGRDLDDEPLPAGYGRPQTVRQPELGEPAARSPEGERSPDGERRGRRRRRGRGDDAGRRPAAEAGSESSRRRGRRGRRSGDGDRDRTSSSSSLARRSRDDFAPVARGYDEDDEGLEFLGVEDAAHEQPRREQRHAEDDVIAESGLDAVRDVPSWVEAIGIVIAGNLDARSRPRSDRSDDDRRRR